MKKSFSVKGSLPLVDFILSQNKESLNLSRVKIIGVQHILDTTVSMLDSLMQYGLNPENVCLIGKCYSTSTSSFKKLIKMKINVSQASFDYNSHESFDSSFEKNIKYLVEDFISSISSDSETDLVIVLDDGGKFLKCFNHSYTGEIPIIGIEQTTDGINTIKAEKINFPVISVARHPLKLQYESPMIAEAVVERALIHLNSSTLKQSKCLIIGGGAIGQSIYKKLSFDFKKVDIFDVNTQSSTLYNCFFKDVLSNYDCIIGCTGKTTLSIDLLKYLKPNAILISASSSDREFDSVNFRKKSKLNYNCHLNNKFDNVTLVNSGFPVNFDGAEENIDPQMIQFTIALMTAAIIQAYQSKSFSLKGILPLDMTLANKVKNEFLSLLTEKQLKQLLVA